MRHRKYGKIPLKVKIVPDDWMIIKAMSYYVEEENGCWSYLKSAKDGYSKFGHKYTLYSAHRVFYTIFKGDLHRGKVIDHLCRNRWCVNPEHLEEVSHVENIRRGVHADVNGNKNPKSTVSEHEARFIIILARSGKTPLEISQLVPEVGRCAVYHIASKRRWTHLWEQMSDKWNIL